MPQKDPGVSRPKILIVDDRPENLYSLEVILKRPGLEIISASSGNQALRELLNHEFALILLDVQMPEMDGFETAELIRCNDKTRYIPIIFITANSKEETQVFKGYESGAVDYIFKPLVPEILRNKVEIFLELYTQRKIIQDQNQSLNRANKQILKHQKHLIEEERVKVVLEMAGAAAHELSQPLMILLGNVDLLMMDAREKGYDTKALDQIKYAGDRLSDIVRRIQKMDHQETVSKENQTQALKLTREVHLLALLNTEEDSQWLNQALEAIPEIKISWETDLERFTRQLDPEYVDLALVELSLFGNVSQVICKKLNDLSQTIPLIGMAQTLDRKQTQDLPIGFHDLVKADKTETADLIQSIRRALEKSRLNQNIQSALKKMAIMSTRDELTGLFNRRYMKEILEQEFKRAQRYDLPLSCLLLDLDHFKRINDTFGHDWGDKILKDFSTLVQTGIRESDYIFRYGGEEFIVLLPQTDEIGAMRLAQNICKKCRTTPFECNTESVTMTVSIGLASIQAHGIGSGKEMVTYADQALYQAKAAGRDCLRIHGQHQHEGLSASYRDTRAVLESEMLSIKTRTQEISIRTFKQLIREMGGDELEEENLQTLRIARHICRKLDLPKSDTQSISRAASMGTCFRFLLGKELLSKSGPLSTDDRVSLEQLPHQQLDMINHFSFFQTEKKILLHKHERFDGTGYPNALESEDIPIGSRVLALSSAAAAMVSQRPYRSELDPGEMLTEVVKNAGNQFDPQLVKAFLDVVDEKKIIDVDPADITQARTHFKQNQAPKSK
ncbi:MAG: diguanylate cyclase [Desulfobacterales bacterium]|nr:diguanylate cyclase [Desulfobacterales bacterium]